MAVYKSSHKGSQIDEAVTIAVGNKNKGNANLPIYYDANGVAQTISVDTAATANSNKLLTGGGMYNGLTPKLSNNEIQTTVSTSGLPPSQGAAKNYTDTQVGTLQDPLISSDTINVDSDGKISVTDEVLRRGTSKLDEKVDHFADYGIGNDSTVLSEMDEAKHSTFDLSKFTVVGSPIVTSDFVASGFSSSNYLKVLVLSNITQNNTLKITGHFKTPSTLSGNPVLFSNNTNTSTGSIFIQISANLKRMHVEFVGYSALTVDTSNNFIAENTEYDFILEYNNGTKLKIKESSQSVYTEFNSNGNTAFDLNNEWWIGNLSWQPSTYAFTGSIDLKQFSITVDGVEVFSGNKTGIDTVKADDYTVVGSPLISADGVASKFSTSNYLTTTLNNNGGNIEKVECIFTTGSDITTTQDIIRSNGFVLLCSLINNVFILNVRFGSNDNSWGNTTYDMAVNTTYKYVGTFNKTTGVVDSYLYSFDGTLLNHNTQTRTGFEFLTTDFSAYIGTNASNRYFTGSVDLNSLKIYIDDDLRYQPCLKIPYTLVEDGKKIVDNVYRSRVEDEYNQAGYTPYYTLQSELGDNYTVVGSPTITNGVASGFSTSNYLICNQDFDLSSAASWELNVRFTQTISSSDGYIVGYYTSGSNRYKNIQIQVINSIVNLSISSNGSNWLFAQPTSLTLTNNVTYDIKVKFTGTQYLLEAKTIDSNTYTNYFTYDSTSKTYGLYNTSLGCGGGTSSLAAVLGSIDLNAFKIYVDNKLVYTAGRNYTLPTVEENDIISSAENGVSMYTQRANLALEQTGSCTADTAITFPKPFMNADYALSIPYNSGTKTATGFTPAQDGDYIAEGLGKLL